VTDDGRQVILGAGPLGVSLQARLRDAGIEGAIGRSADISDPAHSTRRSGPPSGSGTSTH